MHACRSTLEDPTGCGALVHYLPPDTMLDLSPDGRVLGFAGAITLGTGVLCGLVPAWRARGIDVTTALKRQSGALTGGAGQRLNRLLVIAQIALSLVVVAGASLLMRTLVNLRTIDAGFSRERLLLFSVDSGRDVAGKPAAELYRRVVARLEALPGVSGVTHASATLLVDEGNGTRFSVEGYVPAPGEIVGGRAFEVGPGFFATMGLPLLRGRGLTADDFRAGARPVAVIEEAMARRYFGAADPIGRHVKRGRNFEIVGVARDVKPFAELRESARPTLYHPFFGDDHNLHETHFAVRTAGEPLAVASGLRETVRALAPQARVFNLRTMDAALEEALLRERALAQLSTLFGIFTLGLAGLGLYGLLSFGVVARTREIGLRVALGADGRDVVMFVVRQGLRLSLAGAALGLVGALGAARLLETFFYGVSAMDWPTWGLTSGLLFAVTCVACWLPARRAAKVDPMVALRAE